MKLIGVLRPIPRTAALIALALLPSVGPAAASESSSALEVSVGVGHELTVEVRNVPLVEVLQLVGRRAGVEPTLRGDFSAPVTESFRALPLEDGLRRLAPGRSVAVSYDGNPAAGGALTGIWVMGGPSAPRQSAAVNGVPDPTPAPAGQAKAPSAGPNSASPPTRAAEEQAAAGWASAIHALADEAARGSEAAIARLADASASEPSATAREQAVAALGRLRGSAVEPALAAALADDNPAVRLRAVRGLRGRGTETAIRTLATTLVGDADPQVRLAALSALTSLPGPTMLSGLARAAADPDARVRAAAVQGLAWWDTQLSLRPSKP